MEEQPYAVFDLDLEADEDDETQLSSSEIHHPEDEILRVQNTMAWKEAFSRFRVTVSCKKPCLISWAGAQACLVTLNLDFIVKSRSEASRYHNALLEVSFVDEEAARVDPNGPQPASAMANKPEVLAWAPKLWYGLETVEQRGQTTGVSAGVSDPTGTANLGGYAQWQRQHEVGFRQIIHGTMEDSDAGSIIRWSMGENKSRKSGLLESLSVSAVVGYRPSRKFAVRVNGWFKTFIPLYKPIIGRKDDPIFIDPTTLEVGDGVFGDKELRDTTRLATYHGRFVQ